MPTHDSAKPHLQNIETIASLRATSESHVTRHQRGIERISAFFGRPRTVYIIMAAIAVWVACNGAMAAWGRPSWDPPPFAWLQGLIGLTALLMTISVLTTQNRQSKLDEQRAHLDLQINLLAEQKAASALEDIEGHAEDATPLERR